MPKIYYTKDKNGEEVEVDSILAKQLVDSGKRQPSDFTIEDLPYTNQQPVTQQPMGQQSAMQFGKENIVDPLLKGASAVGGFVDKFAGAPSRVFVNEIINSPTQGQLTDFPIVKGALKAGRQLFRDPSQAPTGKQIMTEAGVSDTPLSEKFPKGFSETGEGATTFKKGGFFDVSPAGVAGLGVDVVADASNVVPIGQMAKLAGKGAGKVAGQTVKTAGKATDYATGTNIAQKVGAGGKEFGKTIATGLKQRFSGKLSEDLPKYLDVGKKNKIDTNLYPKSVKHGKESSISMNEKNIGEGPEGELIRRDNKELHKQINGALAEDVNRMSGGQIYDVETAGKELREGYNAGLKQAFDELDVTYNSIIKDNPRQLIEDKAFVKLESRLNGIEKRMKGQLARGSNESKSAAKQVLDQISAIRRNNGSYKQTVDQLQQVGRENFSSVQKFQTPPDVQEMRNIYGALKDALVETADWIDPNVGKQLRTNNKIMTEIFGDKSVLAGVMGNTKSGNETLFKQLIANGDSKKIQSLKKFLTKDQWDGVKGSYLSSMMAETRAGGIKDGTLFSTLTDPYKSAKFDVMFNPNELDNFMDLLRLKDQVGAPLLSKSATGSSNMFLNFRNDLSRATDAGIAKSITTKKPITQSPLVKRIAKKARRPALKGAQVYSVQERN